MRKIFLYTLIVILAGVGCRKKDNPRIPDFTRVPMPTITKDAGSDITISGSAPNTFTAKFTVDLFFKDDIKPSKFDIVVIKNGNKNNVKLIQAGVASFPTSLTITGAQLATLFGSTIIIGDKFDIGADVYTQNGDKYLAFPAVGEGYGTGVPTLGGASVSVKYEAVCTFVAADFGGNYKVTKDDWNDIGVNQVIPITVVSPTKLSFESPVNGQPIVIDVNAATNVTSVASQSYGDYKVAGIDPTWPYGNNFVSSVPGPLNVVGACDKTISLSLKYVSNNGAQTYGPYTLVLKKQ